MHKLIHVAIPTENGQWPVVILNPVCMGKTYTYDEAKMITGRVSRAGTVQILGLVQIPGLGNLDNSTCHDYIAKITYNDTYVW